MTRRWAPAQERGLLLLIGAALLAGGLTLDLPPTRPAAPAAAPAADRIVLSSVHVILPVYVEPWPVDVNTAHPNDLVRLNGIGPTLAARIVAYREVHGPFGTLDELIRVQGIGSHTLDGLRDQATASAVPSPPAVPSLP